mmetsp:Transcript_77900/g.202460  ORF Transcript_77900/g.202460 Transcript_77900/m.202460 type:complete len:222 (+) Transcript_77900:247-912(+)
MNATPCFDEPLFQLTNKASDHKHGRRCRDQHRNNRTRDRHQGSPIGLLAIIWRAITVIAAMITLSKLAVRCGMATNCQVSLHAAKSSAERSGREATRHVREYDDGERNEPTKGEANECRRPQPWGKCRSEAQDCKRNGHGGCQVGLPGIIWGAIALLLGLMEFALARRGSCLLSAATSGDATWQICEPDDGQHHKAEEHKANKGSGVQPNRCRCCEHSECK